MMAVVLADMVIDMVVGSMVVVMGYQYFRFPR
jgi:hypothetical protein